LTITVAITNTGSVTGAEVVQAYVHDVKSRLPRPEKELAAFEKVFLQPGETKHISLNLNKYSVGYYDTELKAWIAEEGVFKVLVGASSADIRYASSFLCTSCSAFLSSKSLLCPGIPLLSRSRILSRGFSK
jgi:beta-glucosidase